MNVIKAEHMVSYCNKGRKKVRMQRHMVADTKRRTHWGQRVYCPGSKF